MKSFLKPTPRKILLTIYFAFWVSLIWSILFSHAFWFDVGCKPQPSGTDIDMCTFDYYIPLKSFLFRLPLFLPLYLFSALLSFYKKYFWYSFFFITLILVIIFSVADYSIHTRRVTEEERTGIIPPIQKTSTSSAKTANWKTYTGSSFSFKYPSTLTKESQMPQGSGYTQYFKSSDGTYILTIIVKGNYNQLTGKPFSDIGSYIDIKTGVNLKVDGQEAISVCPRAGCENTNDVYFFSKDSKEIISIILETPKDASSLDDSRTKIFNQILSTFKFL